MAAILEAQNIGFGYGERTIFENLSFAVEPGSMTALLGANGAGKTTLLNMAAALVHLREGRVLVHGRDVRDWGRRELSRFVALAPQHLEVPFQFQVEEIVAQGRMPYAGRFGGQSARDRQIVEESMRAVDVFGLRHRVYSELSGGEKQRVKIAIALAQQPKLMLLDEPTQHLDVGRQIEIVRLMRRLNESGITMLAAIHDLQLARQNFEHSILLTNGGCCAGATDKVMQPELLEEAFGVDRSGLENVCGASPVTRSAAWFDQRNVRERRLRGMRPR